MNIYQDPLSLLKGCDNYDDFQIPDDSDCRDCSAFAFYFEYDQEEKIRIKVFPGLAYCIGIFADYGNDARKTSGDSNGSWYIPAYLFLKSFFIRNLSIFLLFDFISVLLSIRTMRLIRHRRKIEEFPVEMRDRQGGVSFISPLVSVYYMLKVTLAIIIERVR